jgi:hypothetical protein
MKVEAYNSAIAASAVLRELIRALEVNRVLPADKLAHVWADAARKLNSTGDPAFQEAAKAVSALYSR